MFKNIALKREQIRADAMIKVEEIKARNQLELEKLIAQEQSKPTINDRISDSGDNRVVRERINP